MIYTTVAGVRFSLVCELGAQMDIQVQDPDTSTEAAPI